MTSSLDSNTLSLGERRFGRLVGDPARVGDGDVVLERTDDGVVLQVTWPSPAAGPVPRWFRAESDVFDLIDPEAAAEVHDVPRLLRFRDRRGFVTLLGCRRGGYSARSGGPGSGRIRVQHIVFGGHEDCDYTAAVALRAVVSHLRNWVGASAWTAYESSGRGLEYRRELSEDVELGRWGAVDIVLRPQARLAEREESDLIELRTDLLVETRARTPVAWERHLRVHTALRDLLVISGWHTEVGLIHSVQHPADVYVYRDGDERMFWRPVTSSHEKTALRPKRRHHLITYQDLGPEGLRCWFGVWSRLRRIIDPIVSSIDMRNVTPVALLAQVGPGVEALGYELSRRDGLSRRKAGGVVLARRLARILVDVGDVLPFNGADWATRMVSTYNGIKHANRDMPDLLDVLNTERECVLVVRAWCALQVGVDRAALRDRLREDAQSRPWVME
ncbi:HEPN domain-containing protein [Curtobacterium sp. B18]|uniref:ApeA N-terminal domain 1-containing protein n=1 Tax=Curtobacterium sp. B18 TaxID=95614 RepID=UPI000345B99E|nr:HEPN domain-containing protein [Curtobacterium sp. B18]